MQCPFCNGFRPANNAPCPSCNAPSPLANDAWNGQNASFPGSQNQAAWGNSGVQNQAAWSGSGVQQNDWSGSNAGQVAFPSSQPNFGGSGVQQVDFLPQSTDNGSDNSFWSQNM